MPTSPGVYSLAALIQKCTYVNSLKQACQLHALILTTVTYAYQSPYLYNNILSVYARCGYLGNSRMVFDKMPQRNIVSFNALIAPYSRTPLTAISAIELFARIGVECLRPNGSTFTSLLQACSVLEDWSMGSLFHAQVVKFGFLNDQRVQTSLLGVYSNCADMFSARKVFVWLDDKDVIAWNSLIFGNLENDEMKGGFQLLDDMLRSGVSPTQYTYSTVLSACNRLRRYRLGQLIHARVIVSYNLADLTLQNALLDMYSNFGDTQAACSVFAKMDIKDLVSWNSMIAGYSENGEGEKAIDLFVKLRRISLKPDQYTFAAIVSASYEYPTAIYGVPLHAQVVRAGFEKDTFVGTKLVSMYFKNGVMEDAKKVFCSISEKDIVLWTEMIINHSRHGDEIGALKLYHGMIQEGHKVDSFSLSGAISACADLAILKQGEMIHSQAIKTGYDFEMSVCGSLLDMYAKNGYIRSAYSIFSQALDPDLKCWNSMLGGYSHHGMADEALDLFYKILEHGIKPDQVTYLSLLSTCKNSGMVEIGKLVLSYMKENGVMPGPKHYSCMVSLLSRAGLLDEAEEMIVSSPFDENRVELWRTLLSSCVNDKNLRIGVHAAEQVLRLDAEDSAAYILLSNLYAGAGKWDVVVEIRKKMRELMLEKDPGFSWLEDKSNIQVFFSGIQSQPEVMDAHASLQRLQENLRKSEVDEFDTSIYST